MCRKYADFNVHIYFFLGALPRPMPWRTYSAPATQPFGAPVFSPRANPNPNPRGYSAPMTQPLGTPVLCASCASLGTLGLLIVSVRACLLPLCQILCGRL